MATEQILACDRTSLEKLGNLLLSLSSWKLGKISFSDWADVFDLFDDILAEQTERVKENEWTLKVDKGSRMTALLESDDLSIVSAALNVLHVCCRRGSFQTRLAKPEQQEEIISRLTCMAKTWPGYEYGLTLPLYCSRNAEIPALATTVTFEVELDENGKWPNQREVAKRKQTFLPTLSCLYSLFSTTLRDISKYITRAVRVIDSASQFDSQIFQNMDGMYIFIHRLSVEIERCRKDLRQEQCVFDVELDISEVGGEPIDDSTTPMEVTTDMQTLCTADVAVQTDDVACPPDELSFSRKSLIRCLISFIKKTIPDLQFSETVRHPTVCETAASLGGGIDMLVRQQSRLRAPAITQFLAFFFLLSCGNSTAVLPKQTDESKRNVLPLFDYVHNVIRFTDTMMNGQTVDEYAKMFADRNGLTLFLRIFTGPNLPPLCYNLKLITQVASVFRVVFSDWRNGVLREILGSGLVHMLGLIWRAVSWEDTRIKAVHFPQSKSEDKPAINASSQSSTTEGAQETSPSKGVTNGQTTGQPNEVIKQLLILTDRCLLQLVEDDSVWETKFISSAGDDFKHFMEESLWLIENLLAIVGPPENEDVLDQQTLTFLQTFVNSTNCVQKPSNGDTQAANDEAEVRNEMERFVDHSSFERLLDMGFPRELALDALLTCSNVEQATEFCLVASANSRRRNQEAVTTAGAPPGQETAAAPTPPAAPPPAIDNFTADGENQTTSPRDAFLSFARQFGHLYSLLELLESYPALVYRTADLVIVTVKLCGFANLQPFFSLLLGKVMRTDWLALVANAVERLLQIALKEKSITSNLVDDRSDVSKEGYEHLCIGDLAQSLAVHLHLLSLLLHTIRTFLGRPSSNNNASPIRDFNFMLRSFEHVACRDMETFIKAVCRVVRLKASLPSSNERDNPDARATCPFLNIRCEPSDDSDKCPPLGHTSQTVLSALLNYLTRDLETTGADASEVSRAGKSADIAQNGSVAGAPECPPAEAVNAGGAVPASSAADVEAQNSNMPSVSKSSVLALLAELIHNYPEVPDFFVSYRFPADLVQRSNEAKRRSSNQSGGGPVGSPCRSALAYILDNLLIEELVPNDKECGSAVKLVIASLAASTQNEEVLSMLVTEVKLALLRALMLPHNCLFKHKRIMAIVSLVTAMKNACPWRDGNSQSRDQRGTGEHVGRVNSIVKWIQKKRLLTDLANVPHYLNLSDPNTIGTMNAVLKAMEDIAHFVLCPVSSTRSAAPNRTVANGAGSQQQNQQQRQARQATSSHRHRHGSSSGRQGSASHNSLDISFLENLLFPTVVRPISESRVDQSNWDGNEGRPGSPDGTRPSETSNADDSNRISLSFGRTEDMAISSQDNEDGSAMDISSQEGDILDEELKPARKTGALFGFLRNDRTFRFAQFIAGNSKVACLTPTIATWSQQVLFTLTANASVHSYLRLAVRFPILDVLNRYYDEEIKDLEEKKAREDLVQVVKDTLNVTGPMETPTGPLNSTPMDQTAQPMVEEPQSEDPPVSADPAIPRQPSPTPQVQEDASFVVETPIVHTTVELPANEDESGGDRGGERPEATTVTQAEAVTVSQPDAITIDLVGGDPATMPPASTGLSRVTDPRLRAILGDVELPEGIDPNFLAELPENIREEVIADQLQILRAQQQSRQSGQRREGAAADGNANENVLDSDISYEFLVALPPELQDEVLAQHRLSRQQARQQREAPDAPLDLAAFFDTLPRALREQVLADADDSQIALLPNHIAEEARRLRATAGNRDPYHVSMLNSLRQYGMLNRFDIGLNSTRLHRLFKNLCYESGTRDWLIRTFLSILDRTYRSAKEATVPKVDWASLEATSGLSTGAGRQQCPAKASKGMSINTVDVNSQRWLNLVVKSSMDTHIKVFQPRQQRPAGKRSNSVANMNINPLFLPALCFIMERPYIMNYFLRLLSTIADALDLVKLSNLTNRGGQDASERVFLEEQLKLLIDVMAVTKKESYTTFNRSYLLQMHTKCKNGDDSRGDSDNLLTKCALNLGLATQRRIFHLLVNAAVELAGTLSDEINALIHDLEQEEEEERAPSTSTAASQAFPRTGSKGIMVDRIVFANYVAFEASNGKVAFILCLKFIGRLIAKAVFDNKYLDCYFTRAFYKHILGKPVK
ncbi:UBA/TS-N domain protein [Trichuris suis]|nr:UBA/TS-N domain protein [Trichuris suis]